MSHLRPHAVVSTPVSPLVDLDLLPPRLRRMVQAILDHQQVLTAYDTGQLTLNWNGPQVRPQLEKVALSSAPPRRLEGP